MLPMTRRQRGAHGKGQPTDRRVPPLQRLDLIASPAYHGSLSGSSRTCSTTPRTCAATIASTSTVCRRTHRVRGGWQAASNARCTAVDRACASRSATPARRGINTSSPLFGEDGECLTCRLSCSSRRSGGSTCIRANGEAVRALRRTRDARADLVGQELLRFVAVDRGGLQNAERDPITGNARRLVTQDMNDRESMYTITRVGRPRDVQAWERLERVQGRLFLRVGRRPRPGAGFDLALRSEIPRPRGPCGAGGGCRQRRWVCHDTQSMRRASRIARCAARRAPPPHRHPNPLKGSRVRR